jgi:hypothetical protein
MAGFFGLVFTLLVISCVNAMDFGCTDEDDVFIRRSLGKTDFDRVTLQTHKPTTDLKTCWLAMEYCNRGLEWVRPTSLLRDAVTCITEGMDVFECKLSYSTTPSVSDMLFKPRAVFTDFSVSELLASGNNVCQCQNLDNGSILDPRTAAEYRLPGDTCLHARTIKVNDVLRNSMSPH